jgi:hypothetical protein
MYTKLIMMLVLLFLTVAILPMRSNHAAQFPEIPCTVCRQTNASCQSYCINLPRPPEVRNRCLAQCRRNYLSCLQICN